jgi:hypothetical protein
MSDKKKLSEREAKVRRILELFPEARDSDRTLTLLYHTLICGINSNAPYAEVMSTEGLPSEESLGRCRRRIQEKDESLRGTKAKEKIRLEEQVAYIEYATDREVGAING